MLYQLTEPPLLFFEEVFEVGRVDEPPVIYS